MFELFGDVGAEGVAATNRRWSNCHAQGTRDGRAPTAAGFSRRRALRVVAMPCPDERRDNGRRERAEYEGRRHERTPPALSERRRRTRRGGRGGFIGLRGARLRCTKCCSLLILSALDEALIAPRIRRQRRRERVLHVAGAREATLRIGIARALEH